MERKAMPLFPELRLPPVRESGWDDRWRGSGAAGFMAGHGGDPPEDSDTQLGRGPRGIGKFALPNTVPQIQEVTNGTRKNQGQQNWCVSEVR
ncbi:unnamed protein product [Sphenostylis stenocarpa]|uniref:Uncharacterized protein n=1 Tax=Sphenostylis stenocarpa TaxID=92480 RepID=A0AA86SYX2_9FABA|nr:unnamed protein product [Sphenostylis stenocarpa]